MDDATNGELYAIPMITRLRGYGIVDGIRTLRDSQIASLFKQARDEGVLQWVMYSQNTTAMTERGFIDYFKDESRVLWMVYCGERLAGWVWLDDLGHRSARIHFCFFRWLSKERLTIRVAREALWFLLGVKFRNGASLQIIRGETPTFNKKAVRFIERVGLKVIGEMPQAAFHFSAGTSSSMLYSYVNRDMLRDSLLHETREEGTRPESGSSSLLERSF
jgi:hypothetical protein